jgi:hypothetical protein
VHPRPGSNPPSANVRGTVDGPAPSTNMATQRTRNAGGAR